MPSKAKAVQLEPLYIRIITTLLMIGVWAVIAIGGLILLMFLNTIFSR